MIAKLSLIIGLAFASSTALAQQLIVWQAADGSPRLVLPRLDDETPEQAVERYFESMQKDPEMAESFSSYRRMDLTKTKFSKLTPVAVSSKTRVLIQANMANDIDPGGYRINSVLEVAKAQKANALVLPPAAALRLNATERVKFENRLYDEFDLRMNIGGDDVHPSLYGQPITWARKEELNATRDALEISLIKRWQARNDEALAKGIQGKPEFGICRGHQIMAIASGHSMYQDNIRDGVSKDGTHLDRLGDPALASKLHWHHVYVQDGLLADLLHKKGDVLVNDWHHESVKANPAARTRVVALAPDGVVEALESSDRLTLSVQFHPELDLATTGNPEFTKMGHGLLRGLFQLAREHRGVRECFALFRVAQ